MQILQTISFIFSFSVGKSSLQEITSWRKIQFSENNLGDKVVLSKKYLSRQSFCPLTCSHITNCNFWCIRPDGFCYFYDLVVSPAYETAENDTIDCYTRKRNDIFFKAPFTSIGGRSPLDKFANLNDGIKDAQTQYCTADVPEQWILIDLQKNSLVYDITLHVRYVQSKNCMDTEVRISSTPPVTPGDFSSWDLFYHIERDCSVVDNFKPFKPKIGQYVSIQKKTDRSFCLIHLEIGGVFINN